MQPTRLPRQRQDAGMRLMGRRWRGLQPYDWHRPWHGGRGERRDARDTKQDSRQDSRKEKVDCKAANQKNNSQCRQDKRDTKQNGRQESRDVRTGEAPKN